MKLFTGEESNWIPLKRNKNKLKKMWQSPKSQSALGGLASFQIEFRFRKNPLAVNLFGIYLLK